MTSRICFPITGEIVPTLVRRHISKRMQKILISLFLIGCQLVGKAQNKNAYSPVSSEFLSTVLMTADEKNSKADWVKSSFAGNIPFSFVYQGKSSSDLLKQWRRNEEVTDSTSKYTVRRISFSDDKTGLVCYVDAKEFNDYPAVEWTVHFKNTGREATPIIENIQSLSTDIPCPYVNGENGDRVQPELYYSKGSQASIEDFICISETLNTNKSLVYSCSSGYSSGLIVMVRGKTASAMYLPIIPSTGKGE